MKKRRKNFQYYWELMDISVIIFIVYSAIGVVFPWANLLGKSFSTILSITLIIFVFGFIGFKVSKDKDANPGKVGAYSGAIMGLVSAIFSILAFYFFPQVINETIQNAAKSGANLSTVKTFVKIGLFAGLVISPAIYSAIGALVVWVSKFVFRKNRK